MIPYSNNSLYGGNQQNQSQTDYTNMSNITGLAGDASKEITETMKSVRDTVAMSFQTLNLTLTSLNSTMRNVATAVSPATRSLFGNKSLTTIPAQGLYNASGPLSFNMQQYLGSQTTMGLYNSGRPFNVSNLEYGYNVGQERGYRLGNMGLDTAASLASLGVSLGGGALASKFAAPLAKRILPGALGRGAGSFLASGFGRGLAGLAGGLGAAGLAGAYLIDDSLKEGQQFIRDTAGIKRLSSRFGTEFSNNQAMNASRYLRGAGISEMFNTNDRDVRLGEAGYRDIMMTGMSNGMFHGESVDKLKDQVKNAANVVKFLAGIMGTKDVKEAMDAMSSLKSMGVNPATNPKFAMGLGTAAFGYGAAAGVSSQQMLQMGMQGGSIFQQQGMAGAGGIIPMMRNMAMAHEMEKRHLLNTTELAVGGGAQGVAANTTAAMAGMMRTPSIGGVALAGALSGGNFSQGMFDKNMKGGYFGMLGQGTQNILNPADYANYYVNQESLLAQFNNGGKGTQNIASVLRGALKNMPFQGKNDEESFNLKAAYIKQQLSLSGLPSDPATIKMITEQVLHPNAGNVDGAYHESLNKGYWGQMNERRRLLGPVSHIGDFFDRVGARGKQLTQAIGMGVAGGILGMTSSDYNDVAGYSPGDASQTAMLNYGKLLKGADPNDILSTDARVLNKANIQTRDMVSDGVSTGAWSRDAAGDYKNTSGADWRNIDKQASSIAPLMARAKYGRFSQYYDKIANGDNGGLLANWGKARSAFGIKGELSTFNELYKSEYGNIRGLWQSSDDEAGAGERAFANALDKNNPNFLNENLRNLQNSDAGKSFMNNFGSNEEEIFKQLGVSNGSALDANTAMTMIGDTTNSKMAAMAKKMGMSQGQLAAMYYYGKTGSHVTDSDLKLHALSGKNLGIATSLSATLAATNGGVDGKDAEMANMLSNSSASFDSLTAGKLRGLGLNDELLNKVLNSSTGTEDMTKAMDALGKISDGKTNDATDLMSGVNTKELRDLVDSAALDPSGLKDKIKALGLKGTNSENMIAAGNSALSKMGRATIGNQFEYLFGGKGKGILDSLKDSPLDAMNKILSMQTDDEQVQGMQSTLSDFKRAHAQGGSAYADFLKGQGMGANTSYEDASRDLILKASKSSASMKEVADKNAFREGKDIRDAMTEQGDALRVVIATKENAHDARKKAEVLTKDAAKGSSGDSADTGSTFMSWLSKQVGTQFGNNGQGNTSTASGFGSTGINASAPGTSTYGRSW